MSRNIIDENEGFGLSINTFWMGNQEGVQFTMPNDYIQMTRKQAIEFLLLVLKRLKQQIREDKINPPWWQEMNK